MNAHKIKRLFPHASEAFLRANTTSDLPPSADVKQPVQAKPLGKKEGTTGHTTRYAVCVVSYRARLADADGLSAKYFVDGLRYMGALPDDTVAIMDYTIRQQKVGTRDEERTEVTITEITPERHLDPFPVECGVV